MPAAGPIGRAALRGKDLDQLVFRRCHLAGSITSAQALQLAHLSRICTLDWHTALATGPPWLRSHRGFKCHLESTLLGLHQVLARLPIRDQGSGFRVQGSGCAPVTLLHVLLTYSTGQPGFPTSSRSTASSVLLSVHSRLVFSCAVPGCSLRTQADASCIRELHCTGPVCTHAHQAPQKHSHLRAVGAACMVVSSASAAGHHSMWVQLLWHRQIQTTSVKSAHLGLPGLGLQATGPHPWCGHTGHGPTSPPPPLSSQATQSGTGVPPTSADTSSK